MKKYLVALLLLSTFKLSGQNVGIQFKENVEWSSILAEAKAQNKLIFVDVFTEWCGPCKEMYQKVFPQPQIGAYFNERFINFKIDAEKGYGKVLAKDYTVNIYPNYLFIDGDGTLIYRVQGFRSPNQIIVDANNAQKELTEGVKIVELQARYDQEKNNPEFMFTYLRKNTDLQLSSYKMLNDYFSLLSPAEKVEEKNIKLVLDNSTWSNNKIQLGSVLDVLLANGDAATKIIAKYELKDLTLNSIQNYAIRNSLDEAIRLRDPNLLKSVLALKPPFKDNWFENKETTVLHYLSSTHQNEEYKQKAIKYIEKSLLKINADSLKARDVEVYNNLLAKEDQTKLTENQKTYLESLKYTQSIQVYRFISNQLKIFLNFDLSPKELKKTQKWIDFINQQTSIDTTYFEQTRTNSKFLQSRQHFKNNNPDAALVIVNELMQEFKDNAYAVGILNALKEEFGLK